MNTKNLDQSYHHKLVKKYGELCGDLHVIEIERAESGLGLSLVGNRDLGQMSVFIAGIHPESPVANDGRIRVGDELLEINGLVLYGRCHLNASAMIKGIETSSIKIIILRNADSLKSMAIKPLKLPPIEHRDDPSTLIPKKTLMKNLKQQSTISSITSMDEDGDADRSTDNGLSSQCLEETMTESSISSTSSPPPPLPDNAHRKTIKLQKGSMGLGFAIQEGSSTGLPGIYIKTITPGGVAAQSELLEVGDNIILVNEQSLAGVSYEKALETLRRTSGCVRLLVAACPASTSAPVDAASSTAASQPGQQTCHQPATHTNNNVPAHTADSSALSGDSMVSMEDTDQVKTQPNNVHTPPGEPHTPKEEAKVESAKEAASEETKEESKEEATKQNGTEEPKKDEPVPVTPVPVISEPEPEVVEEPAVATIKSGKETLIEIQKGKSGLGLSIVGGSDTLLGVIIIHEVYEDGAAAKDGRLWAGDNILSVNDEDLREASHDRAIQALRQTPAVVKMLVFRDEVQLKDEDMYETFTVELMKKPGKGLGLSIVGRRNDTGVFISDIVAGGVAEADGRLQQGDQILSVNGEDMKQATQEQAAAVLKTLMGKLTMNLGRLKGSRPSSRRSSSTSTEKSLKKSESSGNKKGKHAKRKGLSGLSSSKSY